MAEAVDESVESEELAPPRRRRHWRIVAILLGITALALAGVWLARERIADRIVAGQLKDLGLPGSYTVESAGPRRQVLTNVVIGDQANPNLAIERAEVEIVPTFGVPTIGKITLVRPRLYGTWHGARPSFGALDKLIYAKSDTPLRLPDMDLVLIDGRARIDTAAGPVGIKAEGAGNLRGGFAGTMAVAAPKLAYSGCNADGVSAFGKMSIAGEKPRFAGPLRLARLDCPGQSLALRGASLQLDAAAPASLDALEGRFGLAAGTLEWNGNRAARSEGSGKFGLRGGDLTATYKLAGSDVSSSALAAGTLAAEGFVRSRNGFAALESDGALSGSGLRPGPQLDAALARLGQSGKGTLLVPMSGQLREALRREGSSSRFSASYNLRRSGGQTSLVLPRATVVGTSGAELLALSRLQLTTGGPGGPRLSGNLVTGGPGLPRIAGRIERRGDGSSLAELTVAEYRAGSARLALPRFTLVQDRRGALGFTGLAQLSGDLPGGRVEGLALPLDGNWSARTGLAVWRKCMALRFERFAVASLALDGRALTLCPGSGGAMLRSDARGTRLSTGTSGLALAGRLGSTPIRASSGPLGLAWPGALDARRIDIALGGSGDPTTLRFAAITGRLGRVMEGRFSGAEVRLNNVPLDILDASAAWRFADGALAVSEGTLRVEDRQSDDRFRPLIARDAALTLRGDEFTAQALLREPRSDREVLQVAIGHDMGKGIGQAVLTLPALQFDRKLQPDRLTALALGVIANARGTVTGGGRIDWNPAKVTSEGRFSTADFDFAAAFGPVEGVAGTVVFTDLLNLTTAPDQRLKIAAINPGIEVNDGEMSFALQGNNVLMVNGASWPFIDGTLELQPSRMVLGAAEVRRYTLKVDGINAAKFLERLELSNLSASGYFDGALPLVFDENGGRIEGGELVSRAPGGNLSYVGELTYKDLGTMANFAFQALRSLDYRQMRIAMDGNLEGDILTRVRLDGVRQGTAAKKNFLTQRFARLPIQFNININAPFQKLVTTFKSIYDPKYVRDPRELGLVDGKGDAMKVESKPPEKTPDIQAPDSRIVP